MSLSLIANLVNKGYTVEFSSGDDGLIESGEPFAFHVQLRINNEHYHGEYTNSLKETLDDLEHIEEVSSRQ